MKQLPKKLRERIDKNINTNPHNGPRNVECWKWTGAFQGKKGKPETRYPVIWNGYMGKRVSVRKLIYIMHYAHELADDLDFKVKITCNHKWCVNPYHMTLSASKGNNGRFDYIELEAIELLNKSPKHGFTSIARMFDVDPFTIKRITRGISYKHVSKHMS